MASNVSDRPPVIGLSTYREQIRSGVWDIPAAFLPGRYLDAVSATGAVAVLLPPQPATDAAAAAALRGVDALVLTGGLDVAPERYGATRHPLTDPARDDRDAWEIALFQEADRRGMPVLAICRGIQLVNVARGGTLHQHLPESHGTERYRIGGGVFATNSVEVEGGSRLAGIVGEGQLGVHSYHHQAVDRLGDGLAVVAATDDGLVQAVESTEGSYLVGVQWHPEEDAEDRRLFADLAAAAVEFATAQDASTTNAATGASVTVPA